MKNVAVVGSRAYPNLPQVRAYVRSLPRNTVIISGGARGVDRVAEDEAKRCGLEVRVFPAEWDRLGKAAGMIRNKDIVENADFLVAFWDGVSRGTRYSIGYAQERKKPTMVVYPTYIGEEQAKVGYYNVDEGALSEYTKQGR